MAPHLSAYQFVVFLATHMDKKAAANNVRIGRKTEFDITARTDLDLRTFLMRIFVNAQYSPRCFMLAYIYIDRYCGHHGLLVQPRNVRGLLLASLSVAAKVSYEDCCSGVLLADIAGVTQMELNTVELVFVSGFGVLPNTSRKGLYVTRSDFNLYCHDLQAEIGEWEIHPPLKINSVLYDEGPAQERCDDDSSIISSSNSN